MDARLNLAAVTVPGPRRAGDEESARTLASTAAINQFTGLIVSAPDDLRAELRKLKRPAQISRCAQLRDRPAQNIEHRMAVRAYHCGPGAGQLVAPRPLPFRGRLGFFRRRLADPGLFRTP